MSEVTRADLRLTRSILEAQQRWWDVVERASLAWDFPTFHELWTWVEQVPKLPPSRRAQMRWLEAQLVAAGCYRGEPIIPRDRQFEIALAAADVAARALPDRVEHVKYFHQFGLNDREIGREVGISDRQVQRLRHRAGLPANSHGGARTGQWSELHKRRTA